MAGIVATILTIAAMIAALASKKLRNYIIDVGDELSRVSWATLKEVQKSTAIVILLVIVVGFTLFFADTFFQKIINIFMFSAA